MERPVIAIVGLACRYPDASSPRELWRNVLAQRRAFRRLPRERLDLADYFSADRSDPDSIYADQAAVLEGWAFDRERFRIAGSTYRQVDLAHWLALEVAADALADAGYAEGEGLPRATTGVVLGNTLTGEFSRASTLRLRWPYVRRVADAALRERGWTPGDRASLLEELEARFKEPFPEVGEESLAGGLSNTIAGRVCNYFDLKGGGFTVDGACAASLLAVANACALLASGDLDLAIAGGVDLSLDPFELVGFARTGALAPERMRVYDARSAGFWPGEGCGFVVLMRHDEALAAGRRPYALVRGWGVASDGSGGITRPEVAGQLLAVERAYRRAGFDIGTVGYLEGHGTGTQVGDQVELEVLGRARRAAASTRPAAIGSVKANIGHTKAAAGVAGLLKATLALHHQVVPPTTGCEDPHPALAEAGAPLRIVRDGALWPADQPLRAGVSAMGFGGIDTHLVLEGAGDARRGSLTAEETALLATPQDVELFRFGASDRAALRAQVARVAAYAARVSLAEMGDLAAALDPGAGAGVRAAVVASRPAELERALGRVLEALDAGADRLLDVENGAFVGAAGAPRIGYLFTGQGAPANVEGGAWRRRFAYASAWLGALELPAGVPARDTRVAQPAIVTASRIALRALADAGVTARAGIGHSLGELTALHWAGAYAADALLRIATASGRAMGELSSPTGAMASLATDDAGARALVGDEPQVVVAGLNAPRQTVISGDAAAVERTIVRARERGVAAVRLPVSHAFHSPLVAAAAAALEARLRAERFAAPTRAVFSTIAGRALAASDDLRALLLDQVTSPVRFAEAFAAADREVELWIEVGPGTVLRDLASSQSATPAIAVDAGGASLSGLLRAIGAAWALGAAVRHDALFAGRFVRPFALDWQPRFLANPCESAPRLDEDARPSPARAKARDAAAAPVDSTAELSVLERVRALVAARAELPPASVRDDLGLLRDLHLNSIVVGQIAAEAARAIGLAPPRDPTQWAGATVKELAVALEELAATGGGAGAAEAEDDRFPAGIDAWVRAFEVRRVERPLPAQASAAPSSDASWQVFAAEDDPLAATLARALAAVPGAGVAVCVPPAPDARDAERLLAAAHALWPRRAGARFVVVERDGSGGGAFARTLHLESPETVVCVVGVPPGDARAAAWVAAEARAARGYAEAHYGSDGVRREPRLALIAPASGALAPALGPDDVLLVTGGGKGIAAECALDLARWTGARLALVGRARPESDPELAANLARMRAAGARVEYYAADVTDPAAVKDAVCAAKRELGRITAVLHGAGVNTPRPLPALDAGELRVTLAPKVDGLRHVLAALDPARLRVLVAFGSIIARAGVPGEADYALANEWLARDVERFQRAHPRCRCLAIEWSVWSGTGMGERLGRIDRLAAAGVQAITPEAGVRALRALLGRSGGPVAVVVAGRFGAPPTLAVDGGETPLLRFLERVRVHVPGVEAVADAELTLENDPYLDDHDWRGAKLFPAVMGLEAMTQVARLAAGAATLPVFENVRFERPITAGPDGRRRIRVAALVRDDGGVDVGGGSAETEFQADHFRATCRFAATPLVNGKAHGAKVNGSAQVVPEPLVKVAPEPVMATSMVVAPEPLPPTVHGHAAADEAIALDPARELYGRVLFQSGRFARVRAYRRLRATESVAELSAASSAPWFGPWTPAALLLGDPGARDAALHSIQASIPHRTLLPVAVERIEVAALDAGAPHVARARERSRDGDAYVYDLDITDAAGRVRERWVGLVLKGAGPTGYAGPWPAPLLGAFLERRMLEHADGRALAAVLQKNGGAAAAVRRALGREVVVAKRPDGKPEIPAEPTTHVSASGAGEWTLAMTGDVPVGCDLEVVTPRAAGDWTALLGADRAALAREIAQWCVEDEDAASTRVWTALECLKKAGLSAATPLRLARTADGGWLVLEAGGAQLATYVAAMDDGARVAVGLLAASR